MCTKIYTQTETNTDARNSFGHEKRYSVRAGTTRAVYSNGHWVARFMNSSTIIKISKTESELCVRLLEDINSALFYPAGYINYALACLASAK